MKTTRHCLPDWLDTVTTVGANFSFKSMRHGRSQTLLERIVLNGCALLLKVTFWLGVWGVTP